MADTLHDAEPDSVLRHDRLDLFRERFLLFSGFLQDPRALLELPRLDICGDARILAHELVDNAMAIALLELCSEYLFKLYLDQVVVLGDFWARLQEPIPARDHFGGRLHQLAQLEQTADLSLRALLRHQPCSGRRPCQ